MASDDIQPVRGGEPELNLLLSKSVLEEPLWKSLLQNLNDLFFPKKQAPLVLTSKPVPVKDIWGFYDYKKNGALFSSRRPCNSGDIDHWWNHTRSAGGTADHETSRGRNSDRARRYASAAAFQNAGGRRWRWWGPRYIAGLEGQAPQAVDGADHTADGGSAQRSSEIGCRTYRSDSAGSPPRF